MTERALIRPHVLGPMSKQVLLDGGAGGEFLAALWAAERLGGVHPLAVNHEAAVLLEDGRTIGAPVDRVLLLDGDQGLGPLEAGQRKCVVHVLPDARDGRRRLWLLLGPDELASVHDFVGVVAVKIGHTHWQRSDGVGRRPNLGNILCLDCCDQVGLGLLLLLLLASHLFLSALFCVGYFRRW